MAIARIPSAVAAALVLHVAAAAYAGDEPKQRGEGERAGRAATDARERFAAFPEADFTSASADFRAAASAGAQGFSGSSGMQIELFGRAGLSLLNVTAEDAFAISIGPDDASESVSASRLVSEVGWGGGARLMWGAWGVEGAYSIFESFALSPSWLVADDTGGAEVQAGVLDQPFVASRANLVVGQLVRTFRLPGSGELSLGFGAGWMRVTDSTTDRLLAGVSIPPPDEITGEVPPDLPPDFLEALVPDVQFTADRSAIVAAGSLGIAFRMGRVLLRPRVDVIIAPALTTDMTLGFPGLADLELPGAEDLGGFNFVYSTSVQPRIFLLSVDVGFSN